MMGVICASNGAVKGAGHQQDKYKLKTMQASFLLDRFTCAGCRRLGTAHSPLGSHYNLRPGGKNWKSDVPADEASPDHRRDNRTRGLSLRLFKPLQRLFSRNMKFLLHFCFQISRTFISDIL